MACCVNVPETGTSKHFLIFFVAPVARVADRPSPKNDLDRVHQGALPALLVRCAGNPIHTNQYFLLSTSPRA